MPVRSRRRFLKRAALLSLGAAAATVGYTWRIEPHWIGLVHQALPIANLPDALIGKTLIQISDLHIGPVVDEAYITRAMQTVSQLQPDILAITGDFMTAAGTEQLDKVSRVLQHLKPGKIATLGILGNHDYGANWINEPAAEQLARRLIDSGINLLRNTKTVVSGLQIVGTDDLWGPNFAPRSALASLDANQAQLVLCHNPDAMDLPVWAGYKGWILSGHTHGGQCSAPFIGPPIIPVKNKRYTAGAFDLFDGRKLYINRGLGYLHRVRFDARPEITVFELQKG